MLEGLFQPLHLLVIFLVAPIVFDPKRLRSLEGAWRGNTWV